MNKNAISQSLTVIGKFDEEYLKESQFRVAKEKESIVLSINRAFDHIWEIYK